MVTQEGDNGSVVAVKGNFDDAQNGVKEIFTSKEFIKMAEENNYKFSSANSINWGRLVPQIVYYFSSYTDLLKNEEIVCGEKINIVVPTGNFGNILAAYYSKIMGLPVNKLICASNENNVLTEFINTGIYNRERNFRTTLSPSMDILISSNLERLLFDITGSDTARIKDWMNSLKEEGKYEISDITKQKIKDIFYANYCDDSVTLNTIKKTQEEYSYVIDTHTAVGKAVYDMYIKETKDTTKTVIASTASPFKFNKNVVSAIEGENSVKDKSEFELLEVLSKISTQKIPKALSGLKNKEILHKTKCKKEDMKQIVMDMLNILKH
jgi:threonine synthase